ncbi:hypothetical protein Pmani_032197 [Petrolisthes manimaculis]|uniref:Uncharacterized protein n=1 Tax=Petrolisthes manimaculis TaxID=1843537 RepID=A0AAE1TR89_9EUCA|nr:hypothetical protein Pmani_032197 [Petrolisthes manimaculis]
MRVGREQCKDEGRHVLRIKKWWEGESEQSKGRVKGKDGGSQSEKQEGMMKVGRNETQLHSPTTHLAASQPTNQPVSQSSPHTQITVHPIYSLSVGRHITGRRSEFVGGSEARHTTTALRTTQYLLSSPSVKPAGFLTPPAADPPPAAAAAPPTP